MRIAVSGTHYMGKSTLIEDFIKTHPEYKHEVEPYDQLHEMKEMELAVEPSLDSLLEELDYSMKQINQYAKEPNIVFDRCPVDFIAYAMCGFEQDAVDINDSEIAERFDDVKEALNNLDLIVFLPMTKEHIIEYPEENPAYRKKADKYFKKLYRDEICDIFPGYGRPRIIEISGERLARIKILDSYLIK